MSGLALQTTTGTPRVAEWRSLVPLVFDRRPATPPWCWLGLLAVGLAAHGGVFLIGSYLPPRKAPQLPAMEVVLTSQPRALKAPSTPKPPVSAPAPGTRARAGRVVAAEPEAPAAAGVTDSIVTGAAETFAGGSTVSSGTSAEPVEASSLPPPSPAPRPLPPPPPKIDTDTVAATRAYLGRIRDALTREKRYPLAAQRVGLEGTVIISFVIDSSGAFRRVTVVSSSGSDLLDQAAVATVNALSRRISRPQQTGMLDLPLKTAIQFKITR